MASASSAGVLRALSMALTSAFARSSTSTDSRRPPTEAQCNGVRPSSSVMAITCPPVAWSKSFVTLTWPAETHSRNGVIPRLSLRVGSALASSSFATSAGEGASDLRTSSASGDLPVASAPVVGPEPSTTSWHARCNKSPRSLWRNHCCSPRVRKAPSKHSNISPLPLATAACKGSASVLGSFVARMTPNPSPSSALCTEGTSLCKMLSKKSTTFSLLEPSRPKPVDPVTKAGEEPECCARAGSATALSVS
mmetsp:Transcript_78587/g.218208  ORF Transcript_78587/g.218208 Transcript_78587/m.218208 type:complete len:251 (+) Transcript_78587:404-1156(+)